MKKLLPLLVAALIPVMNAPAAAPSPATAKSPRPVDGIMDNSFLVEEAYNQEPGVVQHVFTGYYNVNKLRGSDDRAFDMTLTQEWPVFSQRHQFSYTVPYSAVRTGGQSDNGFGDVLLNYRYQAFFDEDTLMAFAPRFSLVLPTGDLGQGLGDDSLGYQWNLPFSTALGDRWFVHANAGLTFLPDAGSAGGRDLWNYNLGASLVYAPAADLHFLLEWVGSWDQSLSSTSRIEREFSHVISPGVRKAFNFDDDAQLVVGLAAPLGLSAAAPDFGAFLYVSFEHRFQKQR